MATKGDRAIKEPEAIALYATGLTLSAISKELDVSVTSLSSWKSNSKEPGADLDEWDLARKRMQEQRQDVVLAQKSRLDTRSRISDLISKIYLNFLEAYVAMQVLEIGSREVDCLGKVGSLYYKELDAQLKVEKILADVRDKAKEGGRDTAFIQELDQVTMELLTEKAGI